MKFHKFIVVVLFAALLGLTACGKDALESPAMYEIEGDQAPSFSEVLGDESGTLLALTQPEVAEDEEPDGDEAPKEEESAEEETESEYIYQYGELESGGKAVESYVQALSEGETAFTAIDEQGAAADLPDFESEEGTLSLLRESSEEGRALRVDISWTPEDCTIKVTRPILTLTQPEAEIEAEVEEPEEETTLSARELIDYIEELNPADLNLEGDSMTEYNIFFNEGSVMVDDSLCSKVQIYRVKEPLKTNVFVGNFLIARDKSHLYKMGDQPGSIIELKIEAQNN